MENKIRVIAFLFFAGFLAVLGKLFYWQVFQQSKLKVLAENQYQYSEKIFSQRGKIFSKDGFSLVTNKKEYLMFADPSRLAISTDLLFEKLNSVVTIDNFNKKLLLDKNLFWVNLKNNLSEDQKKGVEKLEIEGINFETKEIRYYPEASMSAHLLGFVGNDSKGLPQGYFGLEGYYDKELKGKYGSFVFEKDALGNQIPIGKIKEEQLIDGRNLYTHIDRGLQFLVEKKLKEGIEKYQAISGSVLIMDPYNGAIIVMASWPSYDQRNFSFYKQELYRNPIISDLYEPGSIFKVIVMASALDGGFVKENEICNECSGPKTINDYTIKTWNDKYYPNSSMTDILVHSDNVGMVYIIEKMGLKNFYSYLKKFFLTEKTDIDLQGEVRSKMLAENKWGKIDLATASFGQGIALTSIEILSAVTAIANGGEIYKPQVVEKIQDFDGFVKIKAEKKGRAVSSKTADIVTEMMVRAVEEGEAKWAKPVGYKIAGKTGTAQIPIEGKYDPDKTVASFVGFAPADSPRFSMLVVLNEPKTSPWGSETAAPLWFSIAKDILRLWKVAPSDN